MRCRVPASVLLVAVAAGAAIPGAQEPQRFRAGVDLITVTVAAIDGGGRPVEDLRARDFTVKVDGKARDVVSAELVKIDPALPAVADTAPIDAPISTNAPVANSRRVAIGIDQTLITPGSITPLLDTAGRFVEGLRPQDYAALVTFPEPGPRVDFTSDTARVRDALGRVVGQPANVYPRRFYLSLTEASAIQEKERVFLDTRDETTWGPMLKRILERGACDGMTYEEFLMAPGDTRVRCLVEISTEAMAHILRARQDANISIRRLESFLTELRAIDGPKALVLISAGLLVEDLTVLDEVTRLAAESRTSIHVIAVDPERDRSETVAAVPTGQSSDDLQDRQLELTGLETVADRTGGSFARVRGGNGAGLFDRLSSELSAWYVVAVERRPGDPERQRVDVEVRRRGVTVRATRTYVATDAGNAKRPKEELLREAMASPMAVTGLPLRVGTYIRRDAESSKVRLHVTAEIGEPSIPGGEFAVGYVVMNGSGDVVASLGRRLTLSRQERSGQPLPFDTAVALEPGTYSLRFGVVDPDGRRGTVVRDLDLIGPIAGGLETGDLVVGDVPADGAALRPEVEPRIRSGRLAGYLELYPSGAESGDLSAAVDIAEGENAPALTTRALNIGPGAQPSWRVASGAVDVSLLPGRYVARVTVKRGTETVRVLSRPFVLERTSGVSTRPADSVRGLPMPPQLQQRTAAYVSTVVGSLVNVVGREEFTLSGPDRRVRSEFLLVRYPGSNRDLLPFRDVTHLNGTAVADRDEQLVDLFLKPISAIRDRVRQITLAAETHVPATLNPIFALAFLQGDVQRRFELTVSDAGAEWPREVKAVTFVETARPTLLRAGPFGDIDVPTRGTAWIEEATGRIVQTELQVGQGRSAPRVVTRFAVDPRLQIMVPMTMRSENPSGVATYSNFRRFTVQTDIAVPPPAQRP